VNPGMRVGAERHLRGGRLTGPPLAATGEVSASNTLLTVGSAAPLSAPASEIKLAAPQRAGDN
jgi:hypothetical protein